VLQRRPNTFAQTNLLPHFSLATKRRTIHSGLPVTRAESREHAMIRCELGHFCGWANDHPMHAANARCATVLMPYLTSLGLRPKIGRTDF